jgi:hypothetical protein
MKNTALVKTLLLFSLIMAVSFLGFSKEKQLDSRWEVATVKIDSFNNDWIGEALNFKKKVKVNYAFKNDAENMYVLFIFKDSKYMSSINKTGMTIWFNREGKKKKKYGIRFTERKISAYELNSFLEKQQGFISEETKNEIRSKPNYFMLSSEVINKNNKSKSPEDVNDKTRTAWFRVKEQQGTVVYEFSIPFEMVSEIDQGIRIEPGKSMKVGFEWGGMTKEMKIAMNRDADLANLPQTCATGSSCEPDLGGNRHSKKSPTTDDSRPRARIRGPKQYCFWVNVQLAENQ